MQELDEVQGCTITLLARANVNGAMAPLCAANLDADDLICGHPCTTRWAGVPGPTFGELHRVPQILLEDVRPVFVTLGTPFSYSPGWK